jgi:hypothetical protein
MNLDCDLACWTQRIIRAALSTHPSGQADIRQRCQNAERSTVDVGVPLLEHTFRDNVRGGLPPMGGLRFGESASAVAVASTAVAARAASACTVQSTKRRLRRHPRGAAPGIVVCTVPAEAALAAMVVEATATAEADSPNRKPHHWW